MATQRFRGARHLVLVASCLIGGCGGEGSDAPDLYSVTGTVKYKGQPVPGAKVLFLGDGTLPPAVGVTNNAGEFELASMAGTGAVAGNHVVAVVKNTETATVSTNMTMEEAAAAAQNPPPPPTETSLIPAKYADATTSGLSYEVSATETNHFDIELTD